MTIRNRLSRYCDEGKPVELYFMLGVKSAYYLARIVRVGQDYVEFDALDDGETTMARNIMPLHLLTGITTECTERNRERLERAFKPF